MHKANLQSITCVKMNNPSFSRIFINIVDLYDNEKHVSPAIVI
jgi:hypothetical protein